MNAKQSLKLCSKQLEEANRILDLNKKDIVDYNACIMYMIRGGSACNWCEDQAECQLEAKGNNGCEEWMLRFQREEKDAGQDQISSTD